MGSPVAAVTPRGRVALVTGGSRNLGRRNNAPINSKISFLPVNTPRSALAMT